jgi:SAM-dependent methyltransferase
MGAGEHRALPSAGEPVAADPRFRAWRGPASLSILSVVAFSPVREEAVRFWCELRGPSTTPVRAAVGVALGLAWGLAAGLPPLTATRLAVLPVLCLLCIWFQLDGAIALVCALLGGLSRHALPVGQVAALTAAIPFVVWVLLVLLPRASPRAPYAPPADAPAWVLAAERVARRYASPASARPTDRVRFHWVRTKLLGDPATQLVAELASGSVLDVGAGRGQLSLLLLLVGRVSDVHGIDWDESKVAAAVHAAEGLDASFVRGDARTAAFPPADTVLLIDVLHYFRADEQDAILDRAAAAVRPGGLLLVREADAESGWRSAVTLWEERVSTLLRVNRGERVRLRPARELAARIEAAGLRCQVRPAWGRTPFSNVVLVGQRAGLSEAGQRG